MQILITGAANGIGAAIAAKAVAEAHRVVAADCDDQGLQALAVASRRQQVRGARLQHRRGGRPAAAWHRRHTVRARSGQDPDARTAARRRRCVADLLGRACARSAGSRRCGSGPGVAQAAGGVLHAVSRRSAGQALQPRRWLGSDDEPALLPNARLLVHHREWASALDLDPYQRDWYCPRGIAGIPEDKLLWVIIENGISVDAYAPQHSPLWGVAKYAKAAHGGLVKPV